MTSFSLPRSSFGLKESGSNDGGKRYSRSKLKGLKAVRSIRGKDDGADSASVDTEDSGLMSIYWAGNDLVCWGLPEGVGCESGCGKGSSVAASGANWVGEENGACSGTASGSSISTSRLGRTA